MLLFSYIRECLGSKYVVKDDSIHYQTVYKCFSNWEKNGILNQVW